jgi:hypothetical protein
MSEGYVAERLRLILAADTLEAAKHDAAMALAVMEQDEHGSSSEADDDRNP